MPLHANAHTGELHALQFEEQPLVLTSLSRQEDPASGADDPLPGNTAGCRVA